MTTARTQREVGCLEWGVAARSLPGERTSGDHFTVAALPDGALAAVVDGLGHGEEAAVAAQRAIAEVDGAPSQSVIGLVRRCHQALQGTRGVVISLAAFSVVDDTMTWLAIGNVTGILMRSDPAATPALESVVMRGGVVGYELPLLRATVTAVSPGDMLVFATDGIHPDFTLRLSAAATPQHLADDILAAYARSTDDALVLVARYRGRGDSPA